MSDTDTTTVAPVVTNYDAFARWATEKYPDACSLTIVVPMTRVDSERFQRALSTLQIVATRFDTEVDPELLGELFARSSVDADGRLIFADKLGPEVVPGIAVVTR